MQIQKILTVWLAVIPYLCFGQVPITFDFTDKKLTGGETITLEGLVYEAPHPNGKTILMTHGSTGGVKENIPVSMRFTKIASEVTKKGYRFVVYTRKGRGLSQGTFVEETGKCDRDSLDWEVADAYPQMEQVVAQVRSRYSAERLVLMGHSRGGFLSAIYAARKPREVLGVVNLAGVWSAFCESKNGGYSHDMLADAAKKFNQQYWAYFENDSYFGLKRFNDPSYEWLADIAKQSGLVFKVYPDGWLLDGHAAAYQRPDLWIDDVAKWLDGLK